MQKKAYGYVMKEDAGRGYRRVVASPKPAEIVEIRMRSTSLVDADQLVICLRWRWYPGYSYRADHLKGRKLPLSIKTLQADLLAERARMQTC